MKLHKVAPPPLSLQSQVVRASFVHVVRDPYVVFPSTLHTWRSFDFTQGLQATRNEGLEEFILEAHERKYQAFERDQNLLEDNRYGTPRV